MSVSSIRHVNAQGETIGLSFQWNDADAVPDLREHQPGTHGPAGKDEWWNSSVFTDFVLMVVAVDRFDEPTEVEASSWGAVKATFQR